MTTKTLMLSALFAVVTGCAADAASPELVLDVDTKDHVAGTLTEGTTAIAFEMMRVPGRHEITLQTINDQPLVTITLERGQLTKTSILGQQLEANEPDGPACLPNCIVDPVFRRPEALSNLESLPEAQLIHDVAFELEAAGIDPSLIAPLTATIK
jgi:hypothetical protein